MKRILLFTVLTVALSSTASAHTPPQGSIGVSFGVFYSSLSPYGEWIAVDNDLYAWRPLNVAAGWRPYMAGRWVWTDDGWYWVSDEPWGWASYHYGRWYHDDYYGWLWMPGYDWAPAWVEWRYGGDYIGWAPLGPYAVFNISFGLHYRTHWVTPGYYWSFVDCGYINSPYVNKYVYRTENNTRYIGRTRSAGSVRYENGRIVTRGPEREYVERRGRVRIERADLVDVADRQGERIVRTGERERIEAYRPRIEERGRESAIDRPERTRTAERTLSLDTKRIDVRARDVERESGRDIRKAEEYRGGRDLQREDTRSSDGEGRRGIERRSDPSVQRGRDAERRSDPVVRPPDRRGNDQPRVRSDQPHERKRESVERTQPRREEARSSNPERTMRRPESRPAPRPEQRSNDTQQRDGRRR